jgi:hypothetical protein
LGFIKKIIKALFGAGDGDIRDPDGIYLYIKCDRCGAPVRVRADRRHDLQRDYDSGELILRKEVMDGACFNLIQTTTRFSAGYKIVDQQIEGGEFISWDEYKVLTTPTESQTEAPEIS